MIDDPRIVRFSNEKLRPVTDSVASALMSVQRLLDDAHDSLIYEELRALPKDQVINDGSPADGRNPITVGQMLAFLDNSRASLTQATTADETGWNALQKTRYMAVNPRSVI